MRAYTANMIPGGTTPTINVSQYDNDYAVTVTLIEGAEIYTPPVGATIRVEGTKPDGHGFEYPCTYQGNVVTMPIYTQMTVLSGRFPIELVVYQSGLRVGSCNIIFAVEKAPLGEDTDISETVIPDIIDAAQASAEAAQEAAETAQEAAAEVLSSQIVTSASGDIAVITDGADDVAVKSLVAEITPVQSGSGDPSPTNIRPISGRTGLTVTRAGKNLCSGLHQGIINADGTYTAALSRVTNAISAEYGTPVKAGTYTISSPDLDYCTALTKNANGTVAQSWAGTWNALPFTFTVNADSMLFFSCRKSDNSNIDPTAVFAQLESGSTATVSAPYAATYPITWQTEAGTVYGGTLDVVSGVLTVDTILATVSSFVAENANWSNDSTIAVSSGSALTEPRDGAKRATAVTNMLPNAMGYGIDTAVGSQYTTTPCFGFNTNDTYNRYLYARFPKTIGTTLAEVNAYLAENPLVLAYAIQTPQTYQLTPTEVKTLLGGNTIYTDAGSVSVEYVANTKLYIDNKIAELQALVLEN